MVRRKYRRKNRRKHRRIYVSVPIEFHVHAPESGQIPCINSGVLKNISYGGAYFTSINISPLEKGQIQEFTIVSVKEAQNFPYLPIFSGRIRVLRIDLPQPGYHVNGVAIEFISGKFFGYHSK